MTGGDIGVSDPSEAASSLSRNKVPALIAAAATVVVHLILGRRTLLSVGIGTAIYVALVNMS